MPFPPHTFETKPISLMKRVSQLLEVFSPFPIEYYFRLVTRRNFSPQSCHNKLRMCHTQGSSFYFLALTFSEKNFRVTYFKGVKNFFHPHRRDSSRILSSIFTHMHIGMNNNFFTCAKIFIFLSARQR